MPRIKQIEQAFREGGELSRSQIAKMTGLSPASITFYLKKYAERFYDAGDVYVYSQKTKIYGLQAKYLEKTPFDRRVEKFPKQGLTKFAEGFKSLTERFN